MRNRDSVASHPGDLRYRNDHRSDDACPGAAHDDTDLMGIGPMRQAMIQRQAFRDEQREEGQSGTLHDTSR
jgi:hypothetical protein